MGVLTRMRSSWSEIAERFVREPHDVGGKPKVVGGYTGDIVTSRQRAILWSTLAVFLILYGGVITIFGSFYPLQLAAPLLLLLGLVIWALPDMPSAPTRWISRLLVAFIAALLVWPDYLAFAFPGLPWITAIRLVVAPLAAITLVCLSISSDFRSKIKLVISATPISWKLLLAFMALAGMSIAVSSDVGLSIDKFIIAQLYYTLIFFMAAWVFVQQGRVTILAYLLWGIVLYVCAIGVVEWRMQALPWTGRIPSFLVIEDPVVQGILSAKSRAATGIYRLQSKFTTPLGLAEFLAYMTPVVLYFTLTKRHVLIRWAAFGTLPIMLYTIIRTDSRLGFVGFCIGCLVYLLAWSVVQWRNHRSSLFGPAITLAYPALFSLFMASTFFVGRVRALVWGTKAQSFSTQAREEQISAGLPMIWSQPWGRGIGRGAYELGYTNLAGDLTIDTYYLLIGLEFGVLGFLLFFGFFIAQIIYGGFATLKARTTEEMFITPLCIALINFVIIKSIFSQTENHPLVFAMAGAVTALAYRIKMQDERPQAPDNVPETLRLSSS